MPEERQSLITAEFLTNSVADPVYFVYGAFAWGEGTLKPTPRDPDPGPDVWQLEILCAIRDGHLSLEDALKIAVASGHGIGKSALIAWIVLWFINCKPHCNGIVTANTSKQLKGKTWREIGVWLARLRPDLKELWVMTATQLYHKEHERTWFIHAIEWSEKNPDAFAGLHAEWVLVLFDEGAGIADVIYETVMGAMTTPHALWLVFGNPTRNSGYFHSLFNKLRHRWLTWCVDSRVAKRVNHSEIGKWVEDNGEDSDFVRVRVRGLFPRRGSSQLIGTDVTEKAMRRFRDLPMPITFDRPHELLFGPLLIGVDVARFGDDATSIWIRRGKYATRLQRHYGKDTVQVAGFVSEIIEKYDPDAVFVDGTGLGAGVVDQLRHTGHGSILHDIIASEKAVDDKTYKNLRSEMWGKMGLWIAAEAAVMDDQQVLDDITGPEYYYDIHNRIQLEAKDDIKKRGLASPDNGDALALTFARPVSQRMRGGDEDRYGSGGRGESSWAA